MDREKKEKGKKEERETATKKGQHPFKHREREVNSGDQKGGQE